MVDMRSDLPKFVLVCMAPGPHLVDDLDDGTPVDISCQARKGHDSVRGHQWWNDEGTIQVQWHGEPPFNFGDGSWREEPDEVDHEAAARAKKPPTGDLIRRVLEAAMGIEWSDDDRSE